MKIAGFEPGILGIIIYLIFSAFMAKKKKLEKLQKRGAQKSPPTKGKSVLDFLDTIKSEIGKEFNDSIRPKPVVINPTEEKKSKLSEITHKIPKEEMTQISYEEFEKTIQSDYMAASAQDYEYSDFNHEELAQRESEPYSPFKHNSSLKLVMKMSPMKQAIVWKEILDKPVGLRREIELF